MLHRSTCLLMIVGSGFALHLVAPTAPPSLPAPHDMLVDFLSAPAVGVASAKPLFSFSTSLPPQGARNLSIASARVCVYDSNDTMVYDSGDVRQNATAFGVRCGISLDGGKVYRWTASWRASDGRASAVSAPVRFVTALRDASADWRGAQWVGDGHGQFRASFTLNGSSADTARTDALAFVAAPGGFVLRLNGDVVPGGDDVGVSGWFDWTISIPTTTVDLTPLLKPGLNVLLLTVGCGAWCPSPAPTWAHSGRIVHTAAGALPLAKLALRVSIGGGGGSGPAQELVSLVTGDNSFESRPGFVLNSSSWYGSTLDWSLDPEAGWTAPARTVPDDTVSVDIPGALEPLAQPQMSSSQLPPVTAKTVRRFGNASGGDGDLFVFDFGEMVVGTGEVAAGAWSGPGQIQLEFCESLLEGKGSAGDAQPSCLRMFGFTATGTVDTHIVPGTAGAGGTAPLSGVLSWRGFQYVLVRTSGGASFRGLRTDLTARWAGVALEPSSTLSFGGGQPGSAKALSDLRALTARSFRSNLLSGLPTDCPTREKHGWLGDAMDVAVGAMYTFWTPTIFRSFVRQIVSGQARTPASPATNVGFVPVVVPCHQGVDAAQNDLSWTSGFPMTVRWLALHYGDAETVRAQWGPLRSWVDGQLANASSSVGPQARSDGLPDFTAYGDESSQPFVNGSVAYQHTGIRCAAGNFLVALGAATDMALAASATGADNATGADGARWSSALRSLRAAFDARYWSNATASWGEATVAVPHNVSVAVGRQTVDALALAAGVVGAGSGAGVGIAAEDRRAAAQAALVADVVGRGNALAVGAVGQKRLLTTLSEASDAGHDAALRVVLRDSFPGWRYWQSLGATTCWESWTAMDVRGNDHYHGSRNHAWLCGGLAEWLHATLGGVAPAADGFAHVRIAPRVSRTLGPSNVALRLRTVRGEVVSNWTRGDEALACNVGRGGSSSDGATVLAAALLHLRVELPPGITADVSLPLLTHEWQDLQVIDESTGGTVLWSGGNTTSKEYLQSVRVTGFVRGGKEGSPTEERLPRLQMRLGSGRFAFTVRKTSA